MILNGLAVFLQDRSHRIENGPMDDGIVEVESLERRGSNRLSGTTNSLTKSEPWLNFASGQALGFMNG